MSVCSNSSDCKPSSNFCDPSPALGRLGRLNRYVQTQRIPSEVAASDLTPVAKVFFARVWNLSRQGRCECTRPQESVGQDVGLPKATACRAAAELDRAGLITRKRFWTANRRQRITFTVNIAHPWIEGDTLYIPEHVIGNVRPLSALVAAVLLYECGDWGVARVTRSLIASRLGVSLRRVELALENLVGAGFLAAWGSARGHGQTFGFFMNEEAKRHARPGVVPAAILDPVDFHGFEPPPWYSVAEVRGEELGDPARAAAPEPLGGGEYAPPAEATLVEPAGPLSDADGDIVGRPRNLPTESEQKPDLQSKRACARVSSLDFTSWVISADTTEESHHWTFAGPHDAGPNRPTPPVAPPPPAPQAIETLASTFPQSDCRKTSGSVQIDAGQVETAVRGVNVAVAADVDAGDWAHVLGPVEVSGVDEVLSAFSGAVLDEAGVVVPETRADRWAARWLVSWYGTEGAKAIGVATVLWWGGINEVLGFHRPPNLGIFCAKPHLSVQVVLWVRLLAALAEVVESGDLDRWAEERGRFIEGGGAIFDDSMLELIRSLDARSQGEDMARRSGGKPANRKILEVAAEKTAAAEKRSAEKRKKRRAHGHLHAVWTAAIFERFGDDVTVVPWTGAEVSLAKKLASDLGVDKAEAVVRQFIRDWWGDDIPPFKVLWTTRQRTISRVEQSAGERGYKTFDEFWENIGKEAPRGGSRAPWIDEEYDPNHAGGDVDFLK